MSGGELHGGDVFAAARDLGLDWREILDFSANLNPLGPPPGLKKHLFNTFDLTWRYPDPLASAWREEMGARYGLPADMIAAGNGSTALIYHLARVLRPRRAVIVVPAFAEYERALGQCGAEIIQVETSPENDFDPDREVFDRILESRPDMVFLANPSSPAGRLTPGDVLTEFVDRAAKAGVIVVLDEAFLDFTPETGLIDLTRDRPNLIVLRSLTKFYALPGLRLGCLAASAPLAARLLDAAEPWAVNSLALAAGSYCLDCRDYAERTRALVDRERTRLASRLAGLGLGRVVPGTANYLLIEVNPAGPSAPELQRRLREKGILIRNCASFQGLLQGWIRTAVMGPKANKRLVEAVEAVLSGC